MEPIRSADQEKDLDEELAKALENKNYTRAAWIAKRLNKSKDELQSIQEKALRQFIVDYRNPQAVETLLKEYQFSNEQLERLIQDILQNAYQDGTTEKKDAKTQFDVGTMRFLKLDEWIERYVKLRR